MENNTVEVNDIIMVKIATAMTIMMMMMRVTMIDHVHHVGRSTTMYHYLHHQSTFKIVCHARPHSIINRPDVFVTKADKAHDRTSEEWNKF